MPDQALGGSPLGFGIVVEDIHVLSFHVGKTKNKPQWLCLFHRLGMPEQALGGSPLGLGIVVEDKASCYCVLCTGCPYGLK